jgi:fatty acid desaturase
MHGTAHRPARAAHGLLRKSRRFNEFDGVVIGTLSLMSFSLFRVVHQTHHAYLASERDHEFWPLSQTTVPRWKRCLAAFSELNLGLVYTPFVFLRAFFLSPSPVRSNACAPPHLGGIGADGVTVGRLFSLGIATFGLWKYFIWMYLAPAVLAANLQSWRKYIEHVGDDGRHGKWHNSEHRREKLAGRLVAFTLLHEPFHGVHHQRAGLPHSVLPQHVEKLQPKKPGERAPYTSYRYALIELRALPCRSARRAAMANA